MLRRPPPISSSPTTHLGTTTTTDDIRTPLLERKTRQTPQPLASSSPLQPPTIPLGEGLEEMDLSNLSRKSQWIILAVASGACAAFNGVFAKLTTTELTTSFAAAIGRLLGLENGSKALEVIIRAVFFGLNLVFNGVMWALFTKALARGTSTTQVSIINTSSNFMITAILGVFIFTESLKPLWWVGAALLVAGNVIIGRREEKEKDVDSHRGAHDRADNGEAMYNEEDEEVLLGQDLELSDELEVSAKGIREEEEEEDDILDLGTSEDEVRR